MVCFDMMACTRSAAQGGRQAVTAWLGPAPARLLGTATRRMDNSLQAGGASQDSMSDNRLCSACSPCQMDILFLVTKQRSPEVGAALEHKRAVRLAVMELPVVVVPAQDQLCKHKGG